MSTHSPSPVQVTTNRVTLHIPTTGTLSARVGLDPVEEANLARCEQILATKLPVCFDVGRALAEINEKRLYRAQYPTFEAYCEERWHVHRSQAYRLIEASLVQEHLSPMGDNIPQPIHERQVRPLAHLPPEAARKAWSLAVTKAGGRAASGAQVKRAVADLLSSAPTTAPFQWDWQIRVKPLLKEAIELLKTGDKGRLNQTIQRISLLLLIGERPGSGDVSPVTPSTHHRESARNAHDPTITKSKS
jgi:hypothetical protein